MIRTGKKGFTLVELLIAMGIVAVLTTTSILVFKPLEYNRESRDTRRIGDLNTIENAIETARATNPNMSVGIAGTTVYVSVPDPVLVGNATSTCGGVVGIQALPSGWQYQCVSAANVAKTDGTGWMPINFGALPSGSPITALPLDPNNSATNRSYYTYIPQGGMTAKLESVKMIAESGAKDGGIDPTLFELGTSPNPIALSSIPTVATNAGSSITQTTATLSGSANPNGANTTGWFRYATTNPGSCNDTFGTQVGSAALGSGTSVNPYTQGITSLSANTTYYYCAIASNSNGTSFGSMQSFATLNWPIPTLATNAASAIAQTTATLNGTANPNNNATNAWFRYATTNPGSCNNTFGTVTGSQGMGAGSSAAAYTQAIAGLTANTTYYYCSIGQNSGGLGYGSMQSFTTTALPPTVATNAATAIAQTSVTLNSTINPNGASTDGWFRYSTTNPGSCNDTFGTRLPGVTGSFAGSGGSGIAYSQNATGLSGNNTYYYCGIAENAGGKVFGSILSFTTPFNITQWAQLSPSGTPPSTRYGHSAVWDGVARKMYVFGGINASVVNLNDLWVYDAAANSWAQLSPSGTPPVARHDHTAVWDNTRNKMYVFGGTGASIYNDLWSYDAVANSWTQLVPTGTAPTIRFDQSAVWTGTLMYVYGGYDYTNWASDVRSYNPATNAWAAAGFDTVARAAHIAVWTGTEMYYYGGSGSPFNVPVPGPWKFTAGTFTQLSPSGTPPATRSNASAVWDNTGKKMYMFGGTGVGGYYNELWAYDKTANSWALIAPSGTPPVGRYSQSTAWDATSNRMYVFGGVYYNGTSFVYFNDLWSAQ